MALAVSGFACPATPLLETAITPAFTGGELPRNLDSKAIMESNFYTYKREAHPGDALEQKGCGFNGSSKDSPIKRLMGWCSLCPDRLQILVNPKVRGNRE